MVLRNLWSERQRGFFVCKQRSLWVIEELTDQLVAPSPRCLFLWSPLWVLLWSSSQPVLASDHIWINGGSRWQERRYVVWLLTGGCVSFRVVAAESHFLWCLQCLAKAEEAAVTGGFVSTREKHVWASGAAPAVRDATCSGLEIRCTPRWWVFTGEMCMCIALSISGVTGSPF